MSKCVKCLLGHLEGSQEEDLGLAVYSVHVTTGSCDKVSTPMWVPVLLVSQSCWCYLVDQCSHRSALINNCVLVGRIFGEER